MTMHDPNSDVSVHRSAPAPHDGQTVGTVDYGGTPRDGRLQVTIREAAALLSYDERTIRRLVARGELRAIGRGRLRRIELVDLRDWQARNRC
jgi:excisionase family DNA binding protein